MKKHASRLLSVLLALCLALALLPAMAFADDEKFPPSSYTSSTGITVHVYPLLFDRSQYTGIKYLGGGVIEAQLKGSSEYHYYDFLGNRVDYVKKLDPEMKMEFDPYTGQYNGVFKDAAGNTVFSAPFTDVSAFHNGLAQVRVNGKYGFIDATGNMAIPAIYEDAGHFDGARIPVKTGGLWGLIDKTGNLVVPAVYDEIDAEADGLYRATRPTEEKDGYNQEEGTMEIIDEDGKVIFTVPQYLTSCRFHFMPQDCWYNYNPYSGGEGYVTYYLNGYFMATTIGGFLYYGENKIVMADRSGNMQNVPEAVLSVCDQVYSRIAEDRYLVYKNFHYAVVNSKGEFITPYIFTEASYYTFSSFRNGLARVYSSSTPDSPVGVIDTNGTVVIPCLFQGDGGFHSDGPGWYSVVFNDDGVAIDTWYVNGESAGLYILAIDGVANYEFPDPFTPPEPEPVDPNAPDYSGTLKNNLTWTLKDGVLTVTGQGAMADFDQPWAELGLRSKIKSIVISDGITHIGGTSFPYCAATSVTIPASVTSIGSSAFVRCSELTDVRYAGSREQWNQIDIRNNNEPLTGASFTYGVTVPTAPSKPAFTDISDGDWYAKPVAWAAANNIAVGKGGGIFDPNDNCTKVQILTFLWRAEGRTASTVQAPVKGDNPDYQDAMNWAFEKGMIDGSFEPNAPCTRSDAVKYIWQAKGSKDAPASSYTDVTGGEDYAAAVYWAAANGVVLGYPDGSFQPGTVCSRGHIVTFLHRAYVEPYKA